MDSQGVRKFRAARFCEMVAPACSWVLADGGGVVHGGHPEAIFVDPKVVSGGFQDAIICSASRCWGRGRGDEYAVVLNMVPAFIVNVTN
jgi:hypothetical protein